MTSLNCCMSPSIFPYVSSLGGKTTRFSSAAIDACCARPEPSSVGQVTAESPEIASMFPTLARSTISGRNGVARFRIDLHGSRRHLAQRFLHNAHGLMHLFHAYQIAIHVVAPCADRYVKVQPVVNSIWVVLTHVVIDAACT